MNGNKHEYKQRTELELKWPTVTLKDIEWKYKGEVLPVEATIQSHDRLYFDLKLKVFKDEDRTQYQSIVYSVDWSTFTKTFTLRLVFFDALMTKQQKTAFRPKLLPLFQTWWDGDVENRTEIEYFCQLMHKARLLDEIEQEEADLKNSQKELAELDRDLDISLSDEFEIVIKISKEAPDTTALEGDVAYLIEDCLEAYREHVRECPDVEKHNWIDDPCLDSWKFSTSDEWDTKATITLKRVKRH